MAYIEVSSAISRSLLTRVEVSCDVCAARAQRSLFDVFLGLFRHISSYFLTHVEVSCDVCGARAQRSLFDVFPGRSISKYVEVPLDTFRGLF